MLYITLHLEKLYRQHAYLVAIVLYQLLKAGSKDLITLVILDKQKAIALRFELSLAVVNALSRFEVYMGRQEARSTQNMSLSIRTSKA